MKRLWFAIKAVLMLIAVIVIISVYWTAAHFLSEWVYARLNWQPHPLARQLMTSILGFFLFGFSMSVIAPFIRKHEKVFWQNMMDAIQRIAQGDFRVHLPVDRENRNHPFSKLATGINDMVAQLRVMEEMRQEFISNVSHEIGSPLTSIRGFARALKNENLSRAQRMRYLDIIETECVRLSKLSENLLRLTMLESNQPPFFPAPYRLDAQLQTILLRCEPQWAEKELDVGADLEKVVITADEDLLSQVWLNLIHNAIKFTPKGGRITIRLEKRGDRAVVTVSDTGPGIDQQDQHRIFERFYKADKSRHRAAGGSGLGLSIAKKIVEIHQGRISVHSRPGEGAVFTVELPLHASETAQSG